MVLMDSVGDVSQLKITYFFNLFDDSLVAITFFDTTFLYVHLINTIVNAILF